MGIKKIVTGLFLLLMSEIISASQIHSFAVNTSGDITSSQRELLFNVFNYLNKFWSDKGQSLSKDITEKYFTPTTSLIINGKTVYEGYDQFESHFKAVGKNIVGKIHFPLLEVIGVNNKLIVRFDEDIRDNKGNSYPTNIIAVFTLQNNRIDKWEEVVNTKYFCQSDSATVVYSK